MTTYERPTRSEGGQHDNYREDHPAYGLIGAARVSSTPGRPLFGSDFRHQNFISIRIQHGALRRGLSHDWISGTGDPMIAEVALSEAQWATFLSTLNMGEGVPCTLEYVAGQRVPGIEPDNDRRAQFNAEVADTLNDALASLEELRDAAPTKRLRDKAEQAIMHLRSNLPYVARQFDEHAEKTIEKAKIEVAAYVTGAVTRAGLKVLSSDEEPVLRLTEERP